MKYILTDVYDLEQEVSLEQARCLIEQHMAWRVGSGDAEPVQLRTAFDRMELDRTLRRNDQLAIMWATPAPTYNVHQRVQILPRKNALRGWAADVIARRYRPGEGWFYDLQRVLGNNIIDDVEEDLLGYG